MVQAEMIENLGWETREGVAAEARKLTRLTGEEMRKPSNASHGQK